MGYERKRGKLMQLNALLRGKGAAHFSFVHGDSKVFPEIKYVITLDADTQLPRDTAWKMVATLAHPLNRAVCRVDNDKVIAGYGMLQPRIGTDLRDVDDSWYHRMQGNGPDIDPYTYASPDVYKDLFAKALLWERHLRYRHHDTGVAGPVPGEQDIEP